MEKIRILLSVVAILVGVSFLYSQANKEEKDSMKKDNKGDGEKVLVRLLNEKGVLTEPMLVQKIVKTDAAWRAILTPEQYSVVRAEGTERAFCGLFHDNHKEGVYYCAGCGLPVFRSNTKFDSGTGWPSFFQPIAKENIAEDVDNSFGMVRTEVHCPRCGAHFGHVFDDGPAPTGLRYCMNSASLLFEEEKEDGVVASPQIAYFAAGYFWGVEEGFRTVKGVISTSVGYMGGWTTNPTYKTVCSHTTGHAETVQVKYDPSVVSYDQLLSIFWKIHDPTIRGSNGDDESDQYRSEIFFTTPEQEARARASIATLEKSGKSVGTFVDLARPFYLAEDYHQHYVMKHQGADGCSPPVKQP